MATRPKSEQANRPTLPAEMSIKATASFDFEAKAGDGGTATLPRFSMIANTGEPMILEGWKHPVIVDFNGLQIPSQNLPIRRDHERAQGVGHTDSIGVEDGKLVARGVISRDTEAAREVVSSGKNGFPWQTSIGAKAGKPEFVKDGEKVVVNGKTFTGPLVVSRVTTLGEISFTDKGADGNTSAQIAATVPTSTRKGEGSMDFEKWLEAKGIDPAALEDSFRTTLQASYDAEQAKPKVPTTATQSLEQIVDARRQEDQRVDAITALTATAIDDRPALVDEFEKMAKVAIQAKKPVQEFELALLKIRANLAPGTLVRKGDARMGPKIIEAALCLSGGIDAPEKHFDEQTLNAAHDRFPQGLGLRDVLMIAARENGYTGQTSSDLRAVLQAAFTPNIRASGFSTLSLPLTLANVANKFLIDGFTAVEDTWRLIAARRAVRDFKSISTMALTGGMMYEKVGQDGELKHATLGELGYTNKADTYGRMFSVTRQNIINDDLGALTQIPKKLGRGAALKLNDVFWTVFLNNSAFFSAGNANAFSGAATNLQISSLTSAETLFYNQTDPDGFPTAIAPRWLLVPNALAVLGTNLMNSTEVRDTTANTATLTMNPHAGKFKIARSAYLSNVAYTGNSTTAWYLLADPADLAAIEVAFLNGRETPIVESADADFNVLGIQFRGYFDFGVALQEYRAGVRSAGA